MTLLGLILTGMSAAALIYAGWRVIANRSPATGDERASAIDPVPRAAPVIAKGETPTIRLGDSQRIDRLHKILALTAGEHVDLLDATFDGIPRLRISLVSVERVLADDRFPAARDCARIHLELGGAIAGCGALVKEISINNFLVPLATQDEQRCSILHFHGKDDIVNFLRIKVMRLDVDRSNAEMDVLHVSGHWAE